VATLYEGAKKVVQVCAALRPEETGLIITDDDKLDIAQVFRQVIVQEVGASVVLILMEKQKLGGQEPPAPVEAAMCKADVIFGLTTFSLSQTDARITATRHGARVINIPDVQLSDLTSRMIEADFVAISPEVQKMADKLTQGRNFKVTAPGGTHFTFDGTGRAGRGLDALAHEPGVFRSMSVEANIGPLEGTAEGILVIDGSLPPVGHLEAPIRCAIEKGRIVSTEGGMQADQFSTFLGSFDDPNIYMVGEFGIGMNPRARLTGTSYLEDESAIGTCHVGLGSNLSQGGNIKAAGHFDAMILSPTVEMDGEFLMKDGKILAARLEPEE
jgi:leucyl aminopeptidase (aminopeptidase T)